jgi:hypothetical protein
MNAGEKHGAVAGRRHRANPERRPDNLPVYQRRARVPGVSPRHRIEAAKHLDLTICADLQHVCVVCAKVDQISDSDGTRQRKLAGRDRAPFALRRTPAKRVLINDSQRTSMPIGRKRSHRLTGEFLIVGRARKDEQTIAPRCDKYVWLRHWSILKPVRALAKFP